MPFEIKDGGAAGASGGQPTSSEVGGCGADSVPQARALLPFPLEIGGVGGTLPGDT